MFNKFHCKDAIHLVRKNIGDSYSFFLYLCIVIVRKERNVRFLLIISKL